MIEPEKVRGCGHGEIGSTKEKKVMNDEFRKRTEKFLTANEIANCDRALSLLGQCSFAAGVAATH